MSQFPQDYKLSSEEFLNMLNKFHHHHAIFYQLWLMGKPTFSQRYDTAAVVFDNDGGLLEFNINPDFWQTLNQDERLFIVAHECLHVILNHGLRGGKITTLSNVAMDLVVNHTLVNKFGFERAKADSKNQWCWIDTVFKDNVSEIENNQSYEYYHNLLKKEENSLFPSLVDDHSGFSDFSETLKEVADKLTDSDKESLLNSLENQISSEQKAGDMPAGMEFFVPKEKVIKKKKWETIIKKWSLKYLTDIEKVVEQWARINRRFVLMDNTFSIPTEMEIEEFEEDKNKIPVWFFQDTSGSCSGYMTRFFKAAQSLPTNRFDIKMHCFDTRVYETTLESRKLYGFGGTSFSCIENYIIAETAKKNLKYPEAVFIITDGYGNRVMPKYPKNWYWFLTPGGSKSYIDQESKVYDLEKFE